MSKIISQNEQDAKQISDSVKNIFDRFQVSRLLKASNIWKKKGESPVNVMKYAFSLVFATVPCTWTCCSEMMSSLFQKAPITVL